MKMLLTVEIPHEPFNSLVRAGTANEVIGRILESIKPEAAYFTEQDGIRCGIFLINVQNSSEVPAFAEPFFSQFPGQLQVPHCDEPGRSAKGRHGGARQDVGVISAR
ncbi:MAG: hypothetical protein WA173_14070 [Pseudomonas sp.]|uniref:hypothetical protein n=1 Tax=Pseudomonas sp. TaxID=306 RepID=UPI003BB5E261